MILCSSFGCRKPPMGVGANAPVTDANLLSVPDADDLVAFPALPLSADPAFDANPSAGPSESPALAPATQEAPVPLSASGSSALGWNTPWATSDWSGIDASNTTLLVNPDSQQPTALLLNPNPRQSNASTLGRRQERHQAVQEQRQNVLMAFYDPGEGGEGAILVSLLIQLP